MVERYRPEFGRYRLNRKKLKRKTPGRGGRPRGSLNKATAEIRRLAKESGELPHEFQLRIMRMGVGARLIWDEDDEERCHVISWDDVKWAVEKSINFFAPKMSSIRLTGANDGPVQVFHLDPSMLEGCTPQQLKVLEEVFGGLVTGGQRPKQIEGEAVDITAKDYEETLH